ncbi:hypothetical protein [Colwellia sp. E2M01]|uniref:hypothetical protein n=1 Tax=Colwellia sp. E2M01 TaxID=2841561 RepID=UPI001C0962DC|nr:hypothetical protein [Colwellia sp. E2M01]MBU2870528.1 hypothetical protein [Colwellia sp. E2M01]
MMISWVGKITIILSLVTSNALYASCIPSPEPCNDTNTSSTSIEPAVIIIPVVILGAGIWYWLSDNEEPSINSENLKSEDIYSPYSFTLAPLTNNETGGIQLKFAYEF